MLVILAKLHLKVGPQRLSVLRTAALGLFCAIILPAAPVRAELAEQQLAATRSSILALDSARATALRELQGEDLAATEADDYRDFIVYLNTRIVTYCRELQQQGALELLAELPCPTTAMLGSQPAPANLSGEPDARQETGVPPARTRAEQTTELHDRFLESLGEFDQMLLQEDEKVAARVPRQRETGTADANGREGTVGSAGGRGETGTGTGTGAASGEAGADGVTGATGEGEGEPGAVAGQYGQEGQAAAGPAGGGEDQGSATQGRYGVEGGRLPPPEDDDIVARQLREAAEKEPDPELKKKLWEEYWKYKGVRSQ